MTGSVVIAGLHGLLEALQLTGPELGQEVPHRGEPFGARDVQAPLALRSTVSSKRPNVIQAVTPKLRQAETAMPGIAAEIGARPRMAPGRCHGWCLACCCSR
jgi:hypothetical protein